MTNPNPQVKTATLWQLEQVRKVWKPVVWMTGCPAAPYREQVRVHLENGLTKECSRVVELELGQAGAFGARERKVLDAIAELMVEVVYR